MIKFTNQEYKGYLLLILSAFTACFYFIAFKYALNTISVTSFITALFLVGFIYSFFTSIFVKNNFKLTKNNIVVGLQFAIFAILGNYANGKSLEYLSPAITSLFLRTQFVFLFLGGYFLLKEKIGIKLIIGTCISIVGAYVISSSKNLNHLDVEKLIGILWAILAAISFASIVLTQKIYSLKIHPPTVNSIRFFVASIIMLCINNNFDNILNINNKIWIIIIIASLSGPIISRLLIMYSLKYIPVSITPVFSMLTPIFAVIFTYILFSNTPSIIEAIGGVIIILGLLIPLIKKNNS